jgi:hypothetical protein
MNVAALQALLSTVKEPLVGLEFLIYIESVKEVRKNPSNFVCTLCVKHGNFLNIIQHIKSVPHYLKFLRTNLPAVADAFNFPLFMSLHQKSKNLASNNNSSEEFSIIKVIGTEVELMLGRKCPSIVNVDILEDKWKLCLSYFNNALLSRVKPSNQTIKTLIGNIHKKRSALKKSSQDRKKLIESQPRQARSRSPLKEQKYNSRYSNRSRSVEKRWSRKRDHKRLVILHC